MDALIQEQERLASNANLSKSVNDIQKIIDQLTTARDSIAANPTTGAVTLAKLQNPIKQSFEAVTSDIKDVHKGQSKYQKALDLQFKGKPKLASDNDALSDEPHLINRAIFMHLLREGQFEVAAQLRSDVKSQPGHAMDTDGDTLIGDEDLGIDSMKSEELGQTFANMYHILGELRDNRNLLPAIAWARENSDKLEQRGSNLEFELGQLQFVYLFTGGADPLQFDVSREGRYKALLYARQNFSHFQTRYLKEISQLITAMAYESNLATSPYRHVFFNDSTWSYLGNAFTKEFCSLLGLSAESPLYTAATAGAIALPKFVRMKSVMLAKRAEWTTAQELPSETPLPPSYIFHSIFVCPVSKEQTTDENPPMMMPCGHVIAQETMAKMSRGSKFKCPYCPIESRPEEAIKLFL